MLIDTHCHLNFKAFKKDLNEVIKRAKDAGVEKIIVVGSDLKSSRKAVKLAQKYDSLYASVGIHPHHVTSLNKDINHSQKKLTEILTILAKNKKVVAIGETGLDYHTYQKSKYGPIDNNKSLQKTFFDLHLNLAKKIDLPLIIHCRKAHDDLLEILGLGARVLKQKGVLHCFEGDKNHLKKALNLGFYIGFNGMVTYPERKKLKNLVKITPIERILLETDSPFLTPEPLRGTRKKLAPLVFLAGARNEPKNLKIVAEKISEIKNISFREISKKTTDNSYSLFPF